MSAFTAAELEYLRCQHDGFRNGVAVGVELVVSVLFFAALDLRARAA